MIDFIFLLLSTTISQLNTNAPIRTFRPVPTSTINFITNIITRPPRTSTTEISSTSSFLTTTLSTTAQAVTTEPLDEDDQSIRDAIIVGTIWGAIALIILYVCCRKKELEPIEPASLEYVKEKSYSSHVYAEIDDHPYEMPTILEEPYGQQVTAL